MGYRFDRHDMPPEWVRRFPVRNGATATIALACYYIHGHNPKRHDHFGWPRPDHPDSICQLTSNMRFYRQWYNTAEFYKLNLIEEGFDTVSVIFDDSPYLEYVSSEAVIDEEEGNIIRVKFTTDLPEIKDYPVDMLFTVFARNEDTNSTDAVCRGILTILPGASSTFDGPEDLFAERILTRKY